MDSIDFSLIEWSRAVFALTAILYWIFMPLMLGLTWIVAVMETIYVRTKDEKWLHYTRFWLKLLGVNFAAMTAAGLILWIEVGANWSHFAWFAGDVLAPFIILTGVVSIPIASTFIAIIFFGRERVSQRFYLISCYISAIATTVSALWILSIDAWMQNPVGIQFNPESARCELSSFWEIVSSSTAIHKFIHTISASILISAVFIISISAWYLWRRRHREMAKDNIRIASLFGLCALAVTAISGIASHNHLSSTQNIKLAATEHIDTSIPSFCLADTTLSPCIDMLIEGDSLRGIMSVYEKMKRGREAQNVLSALQNAEDGSLEHEIALRKFYDPTWNQDYFAYFGYGYYYDRDINTMRENAQLLKPNIPAVFYSFRIMIISGIFLLVVICVALVLAFGERLEKKKWFYIAAWIASPLSFLASVAGWVVSEGGRQPWVIQDLMPTIAAVSDASPITAQISFGTFAVVYVLLLVVVIRIITHMIKKGLN